ncbi:sugar-binding transcriptional regulator [Naasia sp. SYSU D00057]|uniref:sugar-binding transcriptional regulator n=1 Tax=Naasia sp. SYSU D00057 TaxID=2817380 RepID=UPI001B30455F|nr:sugar-binding transcriptional regulator [Naasia sp. SYSU D00057]
MSHALPYGRDDEFDRERLVRVAWYYYRDDMTQAQIAQKMGVSRPTVARLLDRARTSGVVTIDIQTNGLGGMELPRILREKYGLRDVAVVPQIDESVSGETTNARVALEGAQYLRRYLSPGAVIGVGWGDTVLRTLLSLRRAELAGVTFATLTGGIDAYTTAIRGAANNGIAEFIRFIPAPLLASSPEIAEALGQERLVTEVIDLARGASATLIGIGGAVAQATILQNGLVSEGQLEQYRRQGAIGDILAQWYDADGEVLDMGIERSRVGIRIEELREMPNVIAVAGGMDKLAAIRGALNGRFASVLITTEDVARALAVE